MAIIGIAARSGGQAMQKFGLTRQTIRKILVLLVYGDTHQDSTIFFSNEAFSPGGVFNTIVSRQLPQ